MPRAQLMIAATVGRRVNDVIITNRRRFAVNMPLLESHRIITLPTFAATGLRFEAGRIYRRESINSLPRRAAFSAFLPLPAAHATPRRPIATEIDIFLARWRPIAGDASRLL